MRKKRKPWFAIMATSVTFLLAGCSILIPPIAGEKEVEVQKADIEVEVEVAQTVYTDYVDEILTPGAISERSYQHLVETGRAVLRGEHTYPMSDEFREAAIIAAKGDNIDNLLRSRSSPLAGHGVIFAKEGMARGVCPYLMVALTAAETTFATNGSTVRLHNAWCMKGPQPQLGIPAEGVWCVWPDWESAIAGAATFIDYYWPDAQTAYQLRGYCQGNPPSWIQTVEHFRMVLIGGI